MSPSAKKPYQLKEYQKIRISPRQEVVVGRLYAEGKEFVAVRERVPGSDKTKGIYFDADRLPDLIEALEGLNEFLGKAGSRESGEGQGALF